MRPDFLFESYETESLKTLSLWAQCRGFDLDARHDSKARSPREHFVHQCLSEHGWMVNMLGIDCGEPALPKEESLVAFIQHYARATQGRLANLKTRSSAWFDDEVSFFELQRSRSWVLLRRMTHNAHHRGQLNAFLRAEKAKLFSTYGPTADTGGLAPNGGKVIYPWPDLDALLSAVDNGDPPGPLPGPGDLPSTERP